MPCQSPIVFKKENEYSADIVPCGKCHECLQARRHDWTFRLHQELKICLTANFITLTYETDKIPHTRTGTPTLSKRDCQLFLKRLRKLHANFHKRLFQDQTAPPQLRYFLSGEYGDQFERPHYHLILFNLYDELKEKALDCWNNGHIHIGECNIKTISYTTKYILKDYDKPQYKEDRIERQKEFSLMSRRPAIGHNYLKNTKYHKENLKTVVRNDLDKYQRLPRYYRKKMFDEVELKTLQAEGETKFLVARKEEHERIQKMGEDPYDYKRQQKQHKQDKFKTKYNEHF